MTRAVPGELLWRARDRVPVPAWHRRVPNLPRAVAAAGLALTALGVAALQPWPALLGMAVTALARLRFIGRMVRLHRDMGQPEG